MKTQQEQVKSATRAYIMPINRTKTRFQVYLCDGIHALTNLWPSDSRRTKQSKELLACQIYSTHKDYPAFHFYFRGTGYSRTREIREALLEINSNLVIYELHPGHNPSL
jgi:hypothetical protein